MWWRRGRGKGERRGREAVRKFGEKVRRLEDPYSGRR